MRKRHAVLALLALLSVITYLDRICIGVAGPRMQDDLGLSPEKWGWVLSVFIISYGVFEIPSGAMGDRLGHRGVLMRIVVWWSVFTSLTGLAWNFVVLVITRFLFGMGEAGAYPNMAGVVARWFPAHERARAQGVIWGSSRIGGALSPWIVVPLMAAIGWRHTFLVFGALGVGWAVAWFAWFRDHPAQQPGISAKEIAELDSTGRPVAHQAVPWAKLFRRPQLWLIMAMYWCYVWGSMFYLTWFPTYLVKGRGLTEAEMGVYAALPFVLGALGNFVGGTLCDRLARRFGLARGRRMVGATALLVSALFLVAVASTTGKISGVVLLALGFGVMDCMLPAAWATCVDLGGRYSGAVSGAMNTAGQAGGFVCTVLFGYLVKAYGSYDVPIYIIAGMVMVSAYLFWRIDPSKPLVEQVGAELGEPACA
jgi:MFS family permease